MPSGQALADQAAHRDIGKHRTSEIAAQQLARPGNQLIDQGAIEPKLVANGFDLRRGRLIAGNHDGRIAGRDAQQEKHEQRHEDEDRHGRKHTAKRVARHGRITVFAPALLL